LLKTITVASLAAFTLAGALGQSLTELPEFEVASVKTALPSTTRGGRASASGDRVVYSNTTLKNVLARAFGVKFGNQVTGPSWILTERYDIVAKAPDNTAKEQIPLMLRALLVERFNLKLHHETRELPAYALIAGKGRLKLQEAEDKGTEKNAFLINNGRRQAKNMDMATLVQFLSPMLQAPVLDLTGLAGYYNFTLDYSMEELGGMKAQVVLAPGDWAAGPQDNASQASIFSIVEKLGLKLESRKAPFDVVVVDAGNRVPTLN
jgi:uncharacterized protein (TIGR03435 family)